MAKKGGNKRIVKLMQKGNSNRAATQKIAEVPRKEVKI
jgi:hypothetical protein